MSEASMILGRVSVNPRGEYDGGATYDRLDIVQFGGSGWMCRKDGTTGVEPVEGEYWMRFADNGGGDMLASVYDPDSRATNIFGYVDNAVKNVKITTDDEITAESQNPVKSSVIYNALQSKADLGEDGKVKDEQLPEHLIIGEDEALPDVLLKLDADTLEHHSADYFATAEALGGKQDKLTFDKVPAEGSTNPVESQGILSEFEIVLQMYDRIYQGTDLTVKFASEIEASGGDPWAWIQARIRAGNYKGIHIKDYIPFECTDSGRTKLNAEIAGIDTYANYGNTDRLAHHIDFISLEVWQTNHAVNLVNYNNGVSANMNPWLASDLYHWLNSLSGNVPNEEKVNPQLKAVDYTKDGVWYFLPETLKAVIVEKHMLLNRRYSSAGLLDNDDYFDWKDIGKLWLPTECEVFGTPVFGNRDFSVAGSAIQYPIFNGNINRLKRKAGSGNNYSWWLLVPLGSDSTYWCAVNGQGISDRTNANSNLFSTPVCFRIA